MCVCVYSQVMKPEPIYKEIGKLIRARRRRADMAQEGLARQLGLSRATLANIETGRQRILVHQLYGIAKALGAAVGDFLPADLPEPDWTALPIDGELNVEQKKQIASLIGPLTQSSKRTDGTDGETKTGNTRSRGSKAPR